MTQKDTDDVNENIIIKDSMYLQTEFKEKESELFLREYV